MKRFGKDIKNIISNLQELEKKAVEFGVLKPNADEVVTSPNAPANKTNKPITMGHLADIMEHGRSFEHKTGVVLSRKGKKAYIPKGKWIDIPSRPFLATAMLEEKSNVFSEVDKELNSLMSGGKTKPETILKKQGRYMVSAMRNLMGGHEFDDLSPLTIYLKGKDIQLKDTGRLMKSISYKVVDR